MPEFIIAYRGGSKPESPEEGAREMERWKAWIGGLGDAVVNPGTPLGPSRIVTADGGDGEAGPDRLSGFSVVRADDLDAALAMSRDCPFLAMGTLEVAEMKTM